MQIDFNCDMGEGMPTDKDIMPFISSANIACGYHAGDADTMKRTMELCLQYRVKIGAHPSFLDRENFGRKEMNIPANELYDIITQQLLIIKEVAAIFDSTLLHVKPHGALYNMATRDEAIAATIAKAVFEFDPQLLLYGLSGSYLITAASKKGLRTANEVFADRRYQADGSLVPRSQPGAVIEDSNEAIEQALLMIKEKKVIAQNGNAISVEADTICLHGDGEHAVDFARSIHNRFMEEGISVKAL